MTSRTHIVCALTDLPVDGCSLAASHTAILTFGSRAENSAQGPAACALAAMKQVPEAKIREMLFTGARFTARELEPTGFFNYVLPRVDVLPKALALARQIAVKSLPSIRARKVASVNIEGRSWMEAYLDAQAHSGMLTAGADGAEGVKAFLEGRTARIADQ